MVDKSANHALFRSEWSKTANMKFNNWSPPYQKRKQKLTSTSGLTDVSSSDAASHLLAISQVDGVEERILVCWWFTMLVFVQEDGAAADLYSKLLDALVVVHGQQEGLEAGFGLDGKHDGEIFWKNSPWKSNSSVSYNVLNQDENVPIAGQMADCLVFPSIEESVHVLPLANCVVTSK